MPKYNRPFVLPLTDDPAFIRLRPGDHVDDATFARAFPGADMAVKMLAEGFFADPATQAQLPAPASPPAAVSSTDVGTGAREGAA